MEKRIDDIFDWLEKRGSVYMAILMIFAAIYFTPAVVRILTR